MSEAATQSDGSMEFSVRDDRGHINLRGNKEDEEFIASVEKVIGQPLPTEPNTFTSGPHQVFWLGPDEWQITTEAEQVEELVVQLNKATTALHAAVNDLSGGQVMFLLHGHDARDLLAKGCTLDLHASAFPVGCCAQSGLAKANVLLACLDDSPTFAIVVRRSFSDYVRQWLQRARQP